MKFVVNLPYDSRDLIIITTLYDDCDHDDYDHYYDN